MRIVMTTDMVGGVWTFTQELCAGLLALGCDVVLVGLGGRPAARHERWILSMTGMWGERFGFEALTTRLEWMQENGDAFGGAAQVLAKIAKDFDADLFHFNQFCFGALVTDLPKIVTAHSDVLSWAKYCRSGALDDSRWLRQYCALVSAGLARADVVTAPTGWMMTEVGENFALPVERIVIPNGRMVLPQAGTHRRCQAVTAGRLWDEAKNVALLDMVFSPFPLLVAGEATCDHGEAPAMSNVSLVGALDERDLFALFRESAFYICTSRYEPFGLAPLEAALCGCAIVANDIPSLREVWGEAALYFTDASSLSRTLCELDDDAILAAQARSHARAARYTREAMAASYLEVFLSAVESVERRSVAHVA